MREAKFVSVFVLLSLLLSIAPAVVLAQAPDGNELPPGIDEDVAQSVELVVGAGETKDGGLDSLCDTMWWHGLTNLWYGEYGNHYSQSRDEPNHSYPCDIDKIGIRGRLWVNDILRDEVPGEGEMRYSDNSADANATTHEPTADCDDLVYARSNHYFQEAGLPTWEPQTDDTC